VASTSTIRVPESVALTFLTNGFVRAGRFIANHTYLLEVAPRTRRPLYVGFMNTMTFPFMLSPILAAPSWDCLDIRPCS
jgi:hypothetical protein